MQFVGGFLLLLLLLPLLLLLQMAAAEAGKTNTAEEEGGGAGRPPLLLPLTPKWPSYHGGTSLLLLSHAHTRPRYYYSLTKAGIVGGMFAQRCTKWGSTMEEAGILLFLNGSPSPPSSSTHIQKICYHKESISFIRNLLMMVWLSLSLSLSLLFHETTNELLPFCTCGYGDCRKKKVGDVLVMMMMMTMTMLSTASVRNRPWKIATTKLALS